MSRLIEKYRKETVPELMAEFGYTSVMQVPKLEKIVLNMGLGEAIQNPKALEAAERFPLGLELVLGVLDLGHCRRSARAGPATT